mmetsp:Transcript_10583/g.45061  ORF Transcript_10583/g.45061 Transcript_10583/m.45061 type:complete len:208 (+) Transcript_10583:188-811(+)
MTCLAASRRRRSPSSIAGSSASRRGFSRTPRAARRFRARPTAKTMPKAVKRGTARSPGTRITSPRRRDGARRSPRRRSDRKAPALFRAAASRRDARRPCRSSWRSSVSSPRRLTMNTARRLSPCSRSAQTWTWTRTCRETILFPSTPASRFAAATRSRRPARESKTELLWFSTRCLLCRRSVSSPLKNSSREERTLHGQQRRALSTR